MFAQNNVSLLQVRKNQLEENAFQQLYTFLKQSAYAKIEEHYVIAPIDHNVAAFLAQHEIYNQNSNFLMLVDREDND